MSGAVDKWHEASKKVSVFHQLSGGAAADKAAETARLASKKQASWQQRGLDYMMEQEKLPTELRDASMKGLAGLFGLPGYEDTLNLTQKAQGSPIYQAMVDQINQATAQGQGQTGRDASVGGFLRSGPLAQALAEQQQQSGVDKSQALMQVYQQMLGGIQGLGQQPINTNAIAGQMSGIGQTLAQGMTGSAQTAMQGQQQKFGSLDNILGSMFSDIRLKDDVKLLGKVGGHNWYSWTWNDKAKALGLNGVGEGVMAHEVETYAPEAIGENSGFMTVDYDRLRIH